MMSKAEDRAKERYWLEPSNIETHEKYAAYIEGYHQAEKDLELTWEDIAKILDVTDVIANDDSMEEHLKNMSEEEYCQEVVKLFKDLKK